MLERSRIEQLAQIAAVAILVVGCYVVLQPFLPATLFAASVAACTWPLYVWIRRKVGGRSTLAASLMTLLLVLIGLIPFVLLVGSLVDDVPRLVEWVKEAFAAGPPEPPAWLIGLPYVGEQLDDYWQRLAASRDEALALLRRFAQPAQAFLVAVGKVLGEGILQLTLAVFIGFFLYRDGEALMATLRAIATRLAGNLGNSMVETINNTVVGVMYGIVGTALAQGVVAALGLWIAGVPSSLLLGAATFLLSPVPIGPPIVWGGAAIWLFLQDEIAWGVFMLVWGALVVSSIDNFVKPLLISRGAAMPFVLVLLGVFGGVLAFGFIGVFLGPTLLAVGYSLTRRWIAAATPTDAPQP
ncbi:MAG TPA: AI-2E family transporter [Burkholderiales bacterium]|nr:AI-2E family transporter [Burkholderiales bacterium]